MRRARSAVFALALLPIALGCDPYLKRVGEFAAGSVDPVDFPPEYLGGGDPKDGGGLFEPTPAYVGGTPTGYYPFPFPGSLDGSDPLVVGNAFAPAKGYVFDPGASEPFPSVSGCVPPPGYVFDQQRDSVRYDEQGAVLTALPDAPDYAPVVAEIPVLSDGARCQTIKSEGGLLMRPDVAVGAPSGKLLAWAVIDPRAEVLFPDFSLDPVTGLGPQRWGWFDHYLLAFIDGGYIPTEEVPDVGTRLVPQRLYFPLQVPGEDDTGNPIVLDAPGPGQGFDVLEGVRTGAGYSPVCELWAFQPLDPLVPAVDVAEIDPASAQPTGEYVFCLQVLP